MLIRRKTEATMPHAPVSEHLLRTGWADIALWGTSSALIIAACAGAAFAIEHFRPADSPAGSPETAIFIDFAEVEASPISEDPEVAPGEMMMESEGTPEPAPEPEPVPELVREFTPDPIPRTDPIPEQAMPLAQAPMPDAGLVPMPMPEAPPAPEPEVALPLPPALAEMDEDMLAPDRSLRPRQRPEPPAPPPPAQAAAPQTSAPPPSEQQAEQAAAPQTQAGTQPSADTLQSWQSTVMRHLARRQQYPRGAERRREQGTAVVRFSINAGGQVLSVALVRSSGSDELDQAALQLVQRSSPVPAPPAGSPQSTLTLTAPIQYALRR